MVGIIHHVSEHKRTDETIDQARNHFRALHDTSSDMILLHTSARANHQAGGRPAVACPSRKANYRLNTNTCPRRQPAVTDRPVP